MISKNQVAGSIVLGALALSALIFGGYMIYEKVYLSLLTAHTHERSGIILRVDDPVFFWLWVVTYAVAGTSIFIAGILGLFAAVKYLIKSPMK